MIKQNPTTDTEIQELRDAVRTLRWVVRDALTWRLPAAWDSEARKALAETERFKGPNEH